MGCEVVLVTLLCVIGIFLFPASAGPYSAVHGPVTALQAIRAAARVRWAVVLAAFAFDGFALQSFLAGSRLLKNLRLPHYESPNESCILRW